MKKEWLPGGVLSAVRGKEISLIEIEETAKGKYGNWITLKLKSNSKTLLIINIYRIPTTTPSEGTYSSLI